MSREWVDYTYLGIHSVYFAVTRLSRPLWPQYQEMCTCLAKWKILPNTCTHTYAGSIFARYRAENPPKSKRWNERVERKRDGKTHKGISNYTCNGAATVLFARMIRMIIAVSLWEEKRGNFTKAMREKEYDSNSEAHAHAYTCVCVCRWMQGGKESKSWVRFGCVMHIKNSASAACVFMCVLCNCVSLISYALD